MRMFIILIILTAFMIWLGFALRHSNKRNSTIAFITSAILAVVAIGGFWGWF